MSHPEGERVGKMGLEKRTPERPHVTKEDIKRGLQELGLGAGDIVGVHSSLSSFGYAEGGAEAVIDALLGTVGEAGSVVMPPYSTNRRQLPKTQEEVDLGVTWKYEVLPFDPQNTPCWTGAIPEAFRKHPQALRGSDPAHSLTAVGPRAAELVEGWHALLQLDGYILLLGVGLGCCSSMHLAERGIQLPEHILKNTAPPPELVERCNRGNIEFGFGSYPDFARMEEPCLRKGIMKVATVGEATLKLLRLRDLIDLYAEYLRTNPDRFYHG